jgi:hypothetical protein
MVRMRVLISLGLLVVAGCSSTCKDRTSHSNIFGGGTYHSCDFECCRNEKECRCSGTCPCWKRSDHPKN